MLRTLTLNQRNHFAEGYSLRVVWHVKNNFSVKKMCPGILTEYDFKHKGNHYAILPWFGTKIAQKHGKRIKTKTWLKYSGFRRQVKRHFFTFLTSGQRQVTTCCTCAMTSWKKCYVFGCRRQASDVCCLKCIWSEITLSIFWKFNISKTLFQSLNRVWKKNCDFITSKNCAILLSKMVFESRGQNVLTT